MTTSKKVQKSIKKVNNGLLVTVFENYRNVSFKIASEASYVYKVEKSSLKMVNFDEFFKTVFPDRSLLIGQKLLKNAKMSKIQNAIF